MDGQAYGLIMRPWKMIGTKKRDRKMRRVCARVANGVDMCPLMRKWERGDGIGILERFHMRIEIHHFLPVV